MNITEDYFLLYHGIRHHQLNCYLDIKFGPKDNFLEICAIFLSINRKNYHHFLPVPIFQKLTKKYFKNDTSSIEDIYEYQYNILDMLKPNLTLENIKKLLENLKFLNEQNIITLEEYNKLSNILKIVKTEVNIRKNSNNLYKKEADTPQKEFFYEQKKTLLDIVTQLEEITRAVPHNAKNRLKSKSFSIGITGVINSGKSTMLNALIGKDILGTSVIPETANLTVIKYSTKSFATVKFWNKTQWQKIKNSAKEIESLNDFIKNTENAFKDDIDSFIEEKNKILKIDIAQLKKYTSAADPSKLSSLVQSIELHGRYGFLKEDTQIVDTPGLNDPVVLREEITREYLEECDTLVHLMNVNQASTATDINFIIDTLLYNNISKLIIILTKADTINQNELQEVLEYTKLSIKQNLQKQNKASKFDFVLSKIEFFPLRAKEALVCKTDAKKAKELGYDLKKSGILDIENSIKRVLYSKENQKNILLLNSVKNELLDFIRFHIDQTEFELQLLSKSKDEIEQIQKEVQKEKEENISLLKSLYEDISAETLYIQEQIKRYEKSIHLQLSNLKDVLTTRIIDDISYGLQKEKTVPKRQRLHYIFTNGKKDGLVDIAREFNYTLWKLTSKAEEKICNKYKNRSFDCLVETEYNQTIDKSIINKIVLKSDKIVLEKISKISSKAKLKNLEKLKIELSTELQNYFNEIENELMEILKRLEASRFEELKMKLSKPLSSLKESILQKEQEILEKLKYQKTDESKKEQQRTKAYEKLSRLRILEDDIRANF